MQEILNLHEYLKTAFDIGAKLARDAVWHDDRCTWISYFKDKSGTETTIFKSTIGSNIAVGNAGILMFLNRLIPYYQDPLIIKTARACRAQILHRFDTDQGSKGYFNGSFGQLILLLNTCPPNHPEESIQDYLNLVTEITKQTINEYDISYLDGLTGIIEPMIQLVQTYQYQPHLEMLHEISDILDKSISEGKLNSFSESGYANSKIGILTEILRLSEFLKLNERSSNISQTLSKTYSITPFDFNHWWQHHIGNTQHSKFDPYSVGWRDGFCGLTESKLIAYELTQDLRHKQYAKNGMKTLSRVAEAAIQNSGWFSNFSYNHGLAGIGALLLRGYFKIKKERYLNTARQIGDYGIQQIHWNDFDWPSDIYAPHIFGNNPAHGFLNGMAGTGLFYLDLFEVIKQKEDLEKPEKNEQK